MNKYHWYAIASLLVLCLVTVTGSLAFSLTFGALISLPLSIMWGYVVGRSVRDYKYGPATLFYRAQNLKYAKVQAAQLRLYEGNPYIEHEGKYHQ